MNASSSRSFARYAAERAQLERSGRKKSAFDLMIACTASRAWDPRGGGDRRVQPRGADGQGLAFTPKGYAKTREAARRHERE